MLPIKENVSAQLALARDAQREWSRVPMHKRIKIVRNARRVIASQALEFARASALLRTRPLAETLSAEVLPLLEAHRFVEREAGGLLAVQRLGQRGRPLWLSAVRTEIRREPRGVVLVIGPANYPLFLPAVQILQALAAGNSVLFKPAPGTTNVAHILQQAWNAAGLPAGTFEVLPEAPENVDEVIRKGVDLVVFTGSAAAGTEVLRRCAERLTPAIVELSGCDAVVVRRDADVDLATDALAFGLQLNAGMTCIAPKRVFVAQQIAGQLATCLTNRLKGVELYPAPERVEGACRKLLESAKNCGAFLITGGLQQDRVMLPLVLAGGKESSALLESEIFAPVLVMTSVADDAEAVELAQCSPYALGATVFSRDGASARQIAERLNAGVVSINDMIVPTADPRISFGGRGRSGYGVTRGAEGLLAMTAPKVLTVTKGRRRPHFSPVGDTEADLFSAYIATAHANGWKEKWAGLRNLWAGVKAISKQRRQKSSSQHVT